MVVHSAPPLVSNVLKVLHLENVLNLAQDDDASLARVYAQLAGLTLPSGKS